ncbi:MAG: hypothetical protein IIZ78_00560 [Clostridiales bacterium]|nr:hypothetical protein [Clostridiales bacterium]
MKNWKSNRFKYLWLANFKKKTILQDPEDKYSKHDPNAEYNPSSYRDFEEYFNGHEGDLATFELWSDDNVFIVDFVKAGHPSIRCIRKGKNWAQDVVTILHREKRELHDIKPIYMRNMQADIIEGQLTTPKVLSYTLGYEGIDKNGDKRKKIITVV